MGSRLPTHEVRITNAATRPDPTDLPERLTPELVLVCPELAELARRAAEEPRPALRIAAPAAAPRFPKTTRAARAPGRRRALVPLVFLTLSIVAALMTATLTSATMSPTEEEPETAAAPAPATLVVPDVVGQPYVFAKTTLADGDFAWHVEGDVQGFAANLVTEQRPAPGLELVDTGHPTIVLELARNARYAEQGVPENASPYPGTDVVPAAKAVETTPPPAPPKAKAAPAPQRRKPARRTPDFLVPGAPREPANEMPLTERAFLLASWLANQQRFPSRAERHWHYQHAWIVTGARFGWHGGAEALRILIQLDRDVRARWGVGAEEAAAARAALAEVLKKRKRR